MYKIEYAALKYYNNIISDECLYVGILFHNKTTGCRNFRHISNFKRFQSFDDEADAGFVKIYLQSIKAHIENNIFNDSQEFSLSNFAKLYVNEFKFSKITEMEVEDDEDYVENLTKLYLKFDFRKGSRLSTAEEKRYIKKILSSSNKPFLANKVQGEYRENITFDYVLGDFAVKLFSFKGKQTSVDLIPKAKQWSFSAGELKSTYKVVFLYDNSDVPPDMQRILDILRKNASTYPIEEGLEYILQNIA